MLRKGHIYSTVLEINLWLYLVEKYLQSNKLEGKVGISRDILKYVVLVDCFVDIDRLKEFAHIVFKNIRYFPLTVPFKYYIIEQI